MSVSSSLIKPLKLKTVLYSKPKLRYLKHDWALCKWINELKAEAYGINGNKPKTSETKANISYITITRCEIINSIDKLLEACTMYFGYMSLVRKSGGNLQRPVRVMVRVELTFGVLVEVRVRDTWFVDAVQVVRIYIFLARVWRLAQCNACSNCRCSCMQLNLTSASGRRISMRVEKTSITIIAYRSWFWTSMGWLMQLRLQMEIKSIYCLLKEGSCHNYVKWFSNYVRHWTQAAIKLLAETGKYVDVFRQSTLTSWTIRRTKWKGLQRTMMFWTLYQRLIQTAR